VGCFVGAALAPPVYFVKQSNNGIIQHYSAKGPQLCWKKIFTYSKV